MIYSLDEQTPVLVGDHHFIADGTRIVGDVRLEDSVSVWFNCVLRADNDRIAIGERSNVQDGCVLHADPGFPLTIGKSVTVGHRAMLHGCTIGDNSLIGIGSTILNGATIGRNSIVGANSLVTEKQAFPDNSLIFGAPAKVVRRLTEAEIARNAESASHYIENATHYKTSLRDA